MSSWAEFLKTVDDPAPDAQIMKEHLDMAAVLNKLKQEIGPGRRVCILGGMEFKGSDSKELTKAIAKELAARVGKKAAFITGGMKGVQQTFADNCGDGSQVWNLLPDGQSSGFSQGSDLQGGANLDERKRIFGHIGDIYITIEGGPGVAQEAKDGHARGARIIPLIRTGGASSGMFDFPPTTLEKPTFITDKQWATIKDSSSPVGDCAAAVAAIVEGLILKDRKTCTIFGCCGAVGWPSVLRYLEAGWDVRAFSRTALEKCRGNINFQEDLMKLRSASETDIGCLYVGNFDLALRSDLLDENADSVLRGKHAGKHMAALRSFASKSFDPEKADMDWFDLLESILSDEAWLSDNIALAPDTEVLLHVVDITSSEVSVSETPSHTMKMRDMFHASDVVLNAVGIPSPDDCIKSVGHMRRAFLLNSAILYNLGKLFADLKPKAILATCSTNYVFDVAGFPNQLTEAGFHKQRTFPVLPLPVGQFRHPGESLANALVVFESANPEKGVMRKAVYPAMRFLGEHILHRAAGPDTRLLTFRFPGFYADVGVGTSNTVLAQLSTTPSVWPETLKALQADLVSLSAGAFKPEDVSAAVQKAMDAKAQVDANTRWVMTSIELADQMYITCQQCIDSGICVKDAIQINGESPNVKSDWTVAGFLAFLARHGTPSVCKYFEHESDEEIRLSHLPVSNSKDELVSPQHMFVDSVYSAPSVVTEKMEEVAKFDAHTFWIKRRELGVKQMARNLHGVNRTGRRGAFLIPARYGHRLDEIFNNGNDCPVGHQPGKAAMSCDSSSANVGVKTMPLAPGTQEDKLET